MYTKFYVYCIKIYFITTYTNLIIASMCFMLQDFQITLQMKKYLCTNILEDKFIFKEKLNL